MAEVFVKHDEDNIYFCLMQNDNQIGLLHILETCIDTFIEDDIEFFKDTDNFQQLEETEKIVSEFDLVWHITHFEIEPEYRGHGFGSKLFDYAMQYLDKLNYTKLKYLNACPKDGTPYTFLYEFYQNRGFVTYLDQGTNALMYQIQK